MDATYLRGDIYLADLGQGMGSEQLGNRPVLIVQNNIGNKHSPTVIVAPITSRTKQRGKQPTHYFLNAEFGLASPSVVLLEQLRTIDKQRLSGYIGHLDDSRIQELNKALAVSVGLV